MPRQPVPQPVMGPGYPGTAAEDMLREYQMLAAQGDYRYRTWGDIKDAMKGATTLDELEDTWSYYMDNSDYYAENFDADDFAGIHKILKNTYDTKYSDLSVSDQPDTQPDIIPPTPVIPDPIIPDPIIPVIPGGDVVTTSWDDLVKEYFGGGGAEAGWRRYTGGGAGGQWAPGGWNQALDKMRQGMMGKYAMSGISGGSQQTPWYDPAGGGFLSQYGPGGGGGPALDIKGGLDKLYSWLTSAEVPTNLDENQLRTLGLFQGGDAPGGRDPASMLWNAAMQQDRFANAAPMFRGGMDKIMDMLYKQYEASPEFWMGETGQARPGAWAEYLRKHNIM